MEAKKTQKKEKVKEKLPYVPASIVVNYVVLENGVAAGSAFVDPADSNGEVQEVWEEGTDQNYEFDWGW